MVGANIRKGALAFVMAALAVITPAAIAENTDIVDGFEIRHQAGLLSACVEPDAQTLQAVVPVSTDHGSHATGVVIDQNLVLTAAHAVEGGGHFYIGIAGKIHKAALVQLDHANDLAVLSVDTGDIRPLHLNGIRPNPAQQVWAVGYPRAQSMVTSTGVLQEQRQGALHSSASIDSGQSGGGLLACQNGNWQMLGMLRGFGAYRQGDHYVKIKNHSVSVAAATIHQFLFAEHQ